MFGRPAAVASFVYAISSTKLDGCALLKSEANSGFGDESDSSELGDGSGASAGFEVPRNGSGRWPTSPLRSIDTTGEGFKDRVLLTDAPDLVFDGMTIAGYALGSQTGLMYLRAEYAYLFGDLERNLAERRRLGTLGRHVSGREGFDFDIRIQLGAGAYICGEESALIESLEGKRGAPRDRPPYPTDRGYLGQPTAVNNVETLACVPRILERGAKWFSGFGTVESKGTKLMCLSGDCTRPGVYEVPFGITLNELLDLAGGADAEAVQVSGAAGECVAPKDFGRGLCPTRTKGAVITQL